MTVLTTGPFTPLSRKALLKLFLKARGEKSEAVDRTKISLLGLPLGLGVGLGLGCTKVYSKGWLEYKLASGLLVLLGLLLEHELALGLLIPRLLLLVGPLLGHELVGL